MVELPLVFVIGAPRSGSTWLHNMILAHPACCGPQETHIAISYLAPVREAYSEHERRYVAPFLDAVKSGRLPADRLVGLPSLMSAGEFDEWQRSALDEMVKICLAASPGARVVVEKSPTNSLFVPLLTHLVPECKVIHILRDPLEVVRSLLEVSQAWGRSWAPTTARAAATMWSDYCSAALGARSHHSYLEVRYERLQERPEQELARVFDFLGVGAGEQVTTAAVSASRDSGRELAGRYVLRGDIADAVRDTDYLPEPTGFRREGRITNVTLRGAQLATVVDIVGPLAVTVGYKPDAWPRSSAASLARARAAGRGLAAARSAGRWLMRRPTARALRDVR